ncbi:hypothetical protein E2C01_064573 [Portunus trituberculatus]|uniref:MADF domain-containing protein n=1 Tax=Portunus trituberculatus TaxID=210409 RepID=A0A5B7HKQ0_PORTR|nr:hypothetical protein [Portunus trituberculatus]
MCNTGSARDRCVHTIEQCSTDKIVTNYQWKAERLADDVRSEHQVVYRTLSMFATSKGQTLSGVEVYDIRCCQAHDKQSHLVTGFSKSVSSLVLNCPVNMTSSTSVKEKSCHWDRKETLLLIELYRQNLCLWNVKADVYKDRNKRVAATNEITAGLNRSGLSATTSEVKKKNRIYP